MAVNCLTAFIFLIGSLSAIQIKGCDSMADFNRNNRCPLNGKAFNDVFSKGRYLGEGNFGVVKEIKWGEKRAAVKEIEMPTNLLIKEIQEREIGILKIMNEKNAAANFYGCVVDEEKKKMYLVQEKLYKDLETKGVADKLRSLPAHKRILRYIKIAEAFQRLHENYVAHEDIKTANIMAVDNKLNDFRIIDFGLSVMINEPIVGGSPIHNAPEKVNRQNIVGNMNKPASDVVYATTGHDVYALAMAFAFMETSMKEIIANLSPKCVLHSYTPECSSTILTNVKNGLEKRNQGRLANIILKALDYDRFKRTGSIENLKNELIGLYNELSRENNLPPINESNSVSDLLKSQVEFDNAMKAYEVSMAQKEYTMKDTHIDEDDILTRFLIDEDSDELVDDMTDTVKDYFNFLKIDKVQIASHLI